VALDPLAKMSDDQLRSLIGRANAELRHRERVRTAEFKDVLKLIEEQERKERPSVRA